MDMKTLMGDQDHINENLYAYIQSFSPSVRDIFERFDFFTQIDRLAKSGLLYQVTEKFAGIDLHPETVSNTEMGTVFEELIRKFAEISNETAGEHFTPREVIRLMVNLLFIEDDDVLAKPGVVRTIYDPTAGTGGMLSVAGEYLAEHNPQARLTMFGQELNDESYAICKADMLIKGQDVANIILGNTLSDDGHAAQGLRLHALQSALRRGVEEGREGSPQGTRDSRATTAASVLACPASAMARCSSCCTCSARCVLQGWRQPLRHRAERLAAVHRRRGQRESEIRRYVLENDLVEAIIGLPTDMFYNTGISHLRLDSVSNRKPAAAKARCS